MLEILIGSDWTENSRVLMGKLADDVKNKRPNRILLVPELISHDTERQLCQQAGDTASRFAQVLSFSRLGRKLAQWDRTAMPVCMDNGGRVVAMAAAARQLHGSLKAFAAVETKPEFLTQMLDAVDEFKRCCIDARDLSKAANDASGELAQKLSELSMLLETYDAICANGQMDPRDLLNWVLRQLEDSDYGENHVLYVDGFPDLTRQHMAILEHFIRVSPQVTVSLNCDAVGSERMAFEKAGQTAKELIRIAKHFGVDVCITHVPGRKDALTVLRDQLFQGKIQPNQELAASIHVNRADSVYSECQAAAEDILQLVMSGERYRDIALVCTDMSVYQAVLEPMLRRANIPYYRAGTEKLGSNPALETVFAALDAVDNGFEQRSMLRYLRSAILPVTADDADLIENYAVVWQVQGNGWKQAWINHPEGLSGRWTERSAQLLRHTEDAREKLMLPLVKLHSCMTSAVRLSEQTAALKQYLTDVHFEQMLQKLSNSCAEAGDRRQAQILDQLPGIFYDALEQLDALLGNTVWEIEAFSKLLRLLLDQYDVGTIPTVLDSVHLGPVSAMRCQKCKHLFLLGCQEGSLPGYTGSAGVLNDMERDALRKLDVPLTGGALEGIQAEFSEVYGVFCGAMDAVHLYCSSEEESFVFRRVRTMIDQEPRYRKETALLPNKWVAGALLCRMDQPGMATKLQLQDEYDQLKRSKEFVPGKVSADGVKGLYGEVLNLSASQVDRQAECRLSYFLKYGLRLTERKSAEIDPAEFGTYVHAVLEKTAARIMELGGFDSVSLEDTLRLAREYSAEYAKERFSKIESSRMEYLFAKNVQELDFIVTELWDELRQSRFLPTAFELNFDLGGQMPPIEFSGKMMAARLRGFVDRVDVYQEDGKSYFRVVDYKTGKKSFDYCDVFNGIGLQMLLYMFALEHGGEALIGTDRTAAGVQYFPARAPYLAVSAACVDPGKERDKTHIRSGLLLANGQTLAAMDPLEGMPRLPCKVQKDGQICGDLADEKQLAQLQSYVMQVLRDMVDDIASGNVEANPYTRGTTHDACTYCPYISLCKGSNVDRRNYKEMSAQRFWEEIGKEMDDRG